jgi:predicted Zn-dependent protease
MRFRTAGANARLRSTLQVVRLVSVAGAALASAATVTAQSQPAKVSPFLTLSQDTCNPNPAVLAIESKVRQSVAGARWQDLESAAQDLIRTCPDSDLGYHWLGASYLRQDRTFAAIRALQASQARREDAGVHLLLAEAYFKLGQKRFFWEEINFAKHMSPHEAGVYYLAGLFEFQSEEAYDRAAEWLRQALQNNADHLLARYYLALCLRVKHPAEAELILLDDIRRRQTADVQNAPLLQLLASIEVDLDHPAAALNYARSAARLAPGSAKILAGLGKAAWVNRNLDEARTALESARSLDPNDLAVHYLLSRVYAAQGIDDSARQELTEFQALKEQYQGAN